MDAFATLLEAIFFLAAIYGAHREVVQDNPRREAVIAAERAARQPRRH